MLLLRLILILATLLLIVSGAMYVYTRDRSYLEFAWQLLRFTVLLLLLFAAFYLLERYLLTAWKVLL